MKNNRYFGVLFLLPLLAVIFLGGYFIKYGIMVISLLGLFEYFKAAKRKNVNPLSIYIYAFCVIYYVLLNNEASFKSILLFIVPAVLILLCIPVLNNKYNFVDVAVSVLGFIYIPVFFSFIVLTDMKMYGRYLVWLIFLSSWGCDTFAYYSGKLLGKHKLCPKISPNKTTEGSIGGFLGSVIICAIFGILIKYNAGINIQIYHYVILGAISGIICQFGDLAASSIKRYVQIKDYSHIIPGHGGILDRFDSILFASVVVYYYITFVVGL